MRNNFIPENFQTMVTSLDPHLVFISFWATWPNMFSSLQACINFLVPLLYSLHFFRKGHFISVWSLLIVKVLWLLIFQLYQPFFMKWHALVSNWSRFPTYNLIVKSWKTRDFSVDLFMLIMFKSGQVHISSYKPIVVWGHVYTPMYILQLSKVCLFLCAMEIRSGLFERWITSILELKRKYGLICQHLFTG